MNISAFALTLAAKRALLVPSISGVSAFVPSLAGHGSSRFGINKLHSQSRTFSKRPSSSLFVQPVIMATDDDDDNIRQPKVRRDPVEPNAIEPHATDAEDVRLPPGVILTGGRKLRAEGLTGKGVRVAVIDSGVDANHPGFNNQVKSQTWYRYGTPLSQDDHGTHVAGTIHMLAPEAEIYDYRVFGSQGWRVDRAVAAAISQAVDDGCDIINMSLGGPRASFRIGRAVRQAHAAGVPMIVAAGNEGDNDPLTNELSYPAMRPEAISIAALAKYNNLPVASFSNSNAEVDYSGIGVNVISFKAESTGYRRMSGTSMATPHVCGLVAALMTEGSPYSDLIKDDATLRDLLNDKFALDIGVEGPDNATGLGFLTYLDELEYDSLWGESSI